MNVESPEFTFSLLAKNVFSNWPNRCCIVSMKKIGLKALTTFYIFLSEMKKADSSCVPRMGLLHMLLQTVEPYLNSFYFLQLGNDISVEVSSFQVLILE